MHCLLHKIIQQENLQDTFYLDKTSNAKKIANLNKLEKFLILIKRIGDIIGILMKHKKWSLRTHTTCVTIKHLAENKPDEARIFSLRSCI